MSPGNGLQGGKEYYDYNVAKSLITYVMAELVL